MTRPADQREPHPSAELAELAAALCEGELTPPEATQLEALASASPAARQFLLDYLYLHGELCWESSLAGHSAAGELPSPTEDRPEEVAQLEWTPATLPQRRRPVRRWLGWLVTAAAACVLLVAAAVWFRPRGPADDSRGVAIARLTASWHAQASGAVTLPDDGDVLVAGQVLEFERGMIEIAFAGGGRALLEGPSRFTLERPDRASLEHGRVVVRTNGQRGFLLRTPAGEVIDRGTEFGVAVGPADSCDLEVFEGEVEVRPHTATGELTAAAGRVVSAGQAVRFAAGKVQPVTLAADTFLRHLPPPAARGLSTARLRAVVARHPQLLHHFPFEGNTILEKRRDLRGELDLAEAVMADGRGDGQVQYFTRAVDYSTGAVRPWRDPARGNSVGVSLLTEHRFQPPQAMTVELLLRLADFDDRPDGRIACALATRSDQRHVGFFLVAAEDRTLAVLLDADAPWAETSVKLVPGAWYYAAATFEPVPEAPLRTRVRVYAAALDDSAPQLAQVYEGTIPGTPPASRLGVGKGFDADGAHAYPWSGSLDEVAVYAAALDPATLRQHLAALVGP